MARIRPCLWRCDVPEPFSKILCCPFESSNICVSLARQLDKAATLHAAEHTGDKYRELSIEHRVLAKCLDGRLALPMCSSADSSVRLPHCAQVLLAWGVQRGCAVIPKSTVEARIRENLNVCSFTLDEADLKDIADLDQGRRFNDPAEFAQGMGPLGTFLPIYD
eukprot:6208807-Pleurochrysis_carterae.AAC.1